MLLFVPPERQPAILDVLHELIHVPFRFESAGSQIVVADSEPDYSVAESRRQSQVPTVFRELSPVALPAAEPLN